MVGKGKKRAEIGTYQAAAGYGAALFEGRVVRFDFAGRVGLGYGEIEIAGLRIDNVSHRVSVEVVQPSQSTDSRSEVSPIRQPERGEHVVGGGAGGHGAMSVGKRQRPVVFGAIPQFDAWDRPHPEVFE